MKTIQESAIKCFDSVIQTSEFIKNNRNASFVGLKLLEELGELSGEILIQNYDTYKEAGKDGVAGEACDLFISIVDLAYIMGLADDTREKLDFHRAPATDDNLVADFAIVYGKLLSSDHTNNFQAKLLSQLAEISFAIMHNHFDNEDDRMEVINKKLGKWKKTFVRTAG